jgi:hypothetical protein
METNKESRFCHRAHLKRPLVAEFHHAYPIPISDLSPVGAFLAAELPFSVGQEVHLTLRLGETKAIEVEAVVRRVVMGKGVGVEFVGMSKPDLELLRKILVTARADEEASESSADSA